MSSLRKYIEVVVERCLREEFADSTRKITGPKAVPRQPQVSFNLNQLETLSSTQQVLDYVYSTLRNNLIGEGQGRVVFRLGQGQVLKVAKNPGGTGQNQAESIVCDGNFDLFPKVSKIGPGYLWLVTEEAKPMTEEVFKQLTGLTWTMFRSGLKGAFEHKVKSLEDIDKQNFIDASNNPFFAKIVRLIKQCKYEPGDLAKLDSWGVVNGKPVIVDSGFTEAVNQRFYKKQ